MKNSIKVNIHIYPSNMRNESRIFKISKSIEKTNFFDRIYLLGINKGSSLKNEMIQEENISPLITIFRLNVDSKKWVKTAFFGKIFSILKFWFLAFIFFKKTRPSVINAHNLASLLPCIIYKFFFKSRIVYDTHELETERQGWGKITKFVAKTFELMFIKFVDKIVVVNDPISKWYEDKYSIKPIVINNSPKIFNVKNSNYLRNKFSINHDHKIFIYIGAFSKGRGINKYMNFFKDSDLKISLVFLGDGPLKKSIKNYARQYNNIFFHQSVPFNEVVNIVSSAHFSVSVLRTEKPALSYEYCMPNKLFESMMAGVPILSGGMKYESNFVLENNIGDTIFFEKNIPQFKKSIENLLRKDYKVMKKNCLTLSKVYNWEVEELKIRKYIAELT